MAHVYVRSGATGAATGADWANAYLTLSAALTAKAAGDQFWVSEDHSEAAAAAANITLNSPGIISNLCTIRCVNHAGSVPPVSADLTSGALLVSQTTGNINFNNFADCDGIEFRASSGASFGNININISGSTGYWRFGPLTKFVLPGTSVNSQISIGAPTGVGTACVWDGVVVKLGAIGQQMAVKGRFRWRGGSYDPTGAITSGLILCNAMPAIARLQGVDLSALGAGKVLVATTTTGEIIISDCKVDPAVTYTANPSTMGGRVLFSRTNATGISYGERQYLYTGTEIAAINVIRTNGSLTSHKIDTTANAKFILPYRGLPLSIYNSFTGANRTVTIYGIANMAAMPKNDEFWIDAEYLGSASSPLGSVKTSAKADILATGANLTADTSAWDVGATARANTTTYVIGDVIKVATNSGRVFFCTTAGTTSGSEPAGYASAVDGGSVTDNTAVFRAGWRFSVAVTLTSPQPALAGTIMVIPAMGAASAQIYLGRKLVIS